MFGSDLRTPQGSVDIRSGDLPSGYRLVGLRKPGSTQVSAGDLRGEDPEGSPLSGLRTVRVLPVLVPWHPARGHNIKEGCPTSSQSIFQNALTLRVGHPRMSVGQDSLGVCPEDTYLGVLCPIYRESVECTLECIRPKISLTPGEIWPLFCGTTVSSGTRWTRRGLKTRAQNGLHPGFSLEIGFYLKTLNFLRRTGYKYIVRYPPGLGYEIYDIACSRQRGSYYRPTSEPHSQN